MSMTEVLQFFGDLAELAGPILILAGISSGPAIGALIGTLAGALSVVVGQGLQELAQTESQILPNIPSSPPLVTTSNTASSSVTQYNLKVKYIVSQSPSNSKITFTKSCTCVQTRSSATVSTTTKTASTNGGETSSTASSLDFGTTYQSGDSIAATCKVVQSATTPAGTTTTDRYQQSTTATMVAQDKVISITAAR